MFLDSKELVRLAQILRHIIIISTCLKQESLLSGERFSSLLLTKGLRVQAKVWLGQAKPFFSHSKTL
jgi:hypothetical protein